MIYATIEEKDKIIALEYEKEEIYSKKECEIPKLKGYLSYGESLTIQDFIYKHVYSIDKWIEPITCYEGSLIDNYYISLPENMTVLGYNRLFLKETPTTSWTSALEVISDPTKIDEYVEIYEQELIETLN